MKFFCFVLIFFLSDIWGGGEKVDFEAIEDIKILKGLILKLRRLDLELTSEKRHRNSQIIITSGVILAFVSLHRYVKVKYLDSLKSFFRVAKKKGKIKRDLLGKIDLFLASFFVSENIPLGYAVYKSYLSSDEVLKIKQKIFEVEQSINRKIFQNKLI